MESKEILRGLINKFDNAEVIRFFRSKNDRFSFPHESLYYEDKNFSDGKKLAEGKLPDGSFLVCSFSIQKDLTERSGKKAQYELARKILKSTQSDAGIFIFYDLSGNFRFSLVYTNYLGRHRDWSSFKRFTYFVSREFTNKTFLQQVGEGDFSTLEKIKEAFSVEPVTKQFYEEIASWYFWAMDKVEFPDDEDKDREIRNAKNLIRLITRIIFIWFMKVKKLVPDTLFDKNFVDRILNYKDKTGSTYYKAILQNLFFATLNTQMKKDDPKSRIFVDDAKKFGYISDAYMQQGYYRYRRFIKGTNLFLEQFKDIPFLNGGLFDSLDKKVDGKEIRIDCFSDNKKNETRLQIPDELFFLEKEIVVDLGKHLEPDSKGRVIKKVRGLIPILKSYNFTIDENTPVDEEVALDPELLGKVFENLLASYNPETKTTARKATGSYYTPREIVEYMVNESIVAYLKTALSNDTKDFEDKLRSLLDYNIETNPFENDKKTTHKIIDAIERIKILDPACGSGAFPMGALHKLVLVLHKLDPDNSYWEKLLLEKVPSEIREETEQSLKNKSLDYIRKLGLIEHCIYGVDIQEIAIQISKLRFFISLLVEQQPDDSKPNRDIKSLPNLETKFVAANTLIGLDNPQQMTLKSQEEERLENELFKIREDSFYANSRREKIKLQEKEAKIRHQLKKELRNLGFPNLLAEQITSWNPFDQNTHSGWFDHWWMFGIKDGFDIVIGNPPYIQLQKAANDKYKFADFYKAQGYETFERTGDIYCLFYEKGINLLKENGFLSYITSNKWMRAGYGEKLRKFFTRYNPIILIDLGPGVFENATVDTNILIIQKSNNRNQLKAITLKEEDKNSIYNSVKQKSVILDKLSSEAWFIGSNEEQKLKEKIEKIGKPLKDWDVKIYRGILTGLNDAFIIDNKKREEILKNCRDKEERKRTEAIIKPILRGRDIKRYYYEWAGLWVIFVPWHFPLHEDSSIQGASDKAEKEFKKEYPIIYNHLLKYKDELLKRNKEETGIRYEWYAMQRCAATYYPEFEKEKVVWASVGETYYCWVDKNHLVLDTNYFTTSLQKWQLGVLNSKFIINYINGLDTLVGNVAYRHYKYNFEKIPIPPITTSNEPIVKQIESLVDKILGAKKQNPQADTHHWEKEIDKFMYRLYDLTEEEIRIIKINNRS